MQFHLPSFLEYLKNGLPHDVAMMHHHYICYIVSFYPLKKDVLQDIVIRAVVQTFEAPLVPLHGPQERSLIGGLLDQHREALEGALHDQDTYLQIIKHNGDLAGEKPRYEYRVDIQVLLSLLKDIRLQHDLSLVRDLIQEDFFVSSRYLEKKIFLTTGQAFSRRRIDDVLHELEKQGVIKNNGHQKTYGREVLS